MPIILNGTTGQVFPTWTTAGRPASPSTGQTGFNTTLATLEVYGGSAWEPLVTTNDSGSVTPTMLSQKLTRMTQQSAVSQGVVDFTDIPSWVRRITLMLNGVSKADATDILIQLGVGTTPTTSGYTNGQSIFNYNTGIVGSISTAGAPIFNNAATYVWSGDIRIYNITGDTWVIMGTLHNGGTNTSFTSTGANIALSGTLGMVRLSAGVSTFDAGTVNVMYEG